MRHFLVGFKYCIYVCVVDSGERGWGGGNEDGITLLGGIIDISVYFLSYRVFYRAVVFM